MAEWRRLYLEDVETDLAFWAQKKAGRRTRRAVRAEMKRWKA
jgi:hypothetical protein